MPRIKPVGEASAGDDDRGGQHEGKEEDDDWDPREPVGRAAADEVASEEADDNTASHIVMMERPAHSDLA